MSRSQLYVSSGVRFGCAAVFLGRLLTATEGAALGETLGWAVAALLVLSAAGLAVFLGGLATPDWGWPDLILLALCGAPLLSAAANYGAGDDRALVSLSFEWLGLGATWIGLRITTESMTRSRTGLWRLVAAVAVALSLLGLWQHFQGYATARKEYRQIVNEMDELRAALLNRRASDDASTTQRLRELEAVLISAGIPTDERGRRLWESRLNASSEPVGMFALANTFAGLLLVGVCLWCWTAGRLPGSLLSQRRLWAIIATGVVGFCLLLTKSRSAWGGTICVGLLLSLQTAHREALWRSSRGRTTAFILASFLLLLIGLAAFSGGLDRQIVDESFKSLRYRGEYWVGTWRMMWDGSHPWRWLVGVGPGNFRQNYLPWKLPESSEEIADPHNLILDHWCGGGLLGVVAVIALWLFAAKALFGKSPESDLDPSRAESRIISPELLGCVFTFAVLTALTVDLNRQVQLGCVLVGFLGSWALESWLNCGEPGLVVRSATLLGMLVHLLAAGGISMPAVVQLVMLLSLPVARHLRTPLEPTRRGLLIAAAGAILAVVSTTRGVSPVMGRDLQLGEGDFALSQNALKAAERCYREAARLDRLSPLPWDRLARLAQMRWLQTRNESDFEECIRFRNEAIRKNPGHAAGWRALGEIWNLRYQYSGAPADAARSASALEHAAALHPTHGEILAEWALALDAAGQSAAAIQPAEQALRLEEINVALGHVDKQLPADLVDRLERLRSKHVLPTHVEK